MSAFLSDLRFALRQIRHNPGLAATAVVTLGLGISAVTVIFSVYEAVALSPLPFPDPEQLVRINETSPQGEGSSTSEANYLDFRDQTSSFSQLAAVNFRSMTLAGDDAPEQVAAMLVTASFFPMLETRPALGRNFSREEDEPGASNRVAILRHSLWTRRFGSDPGVLGQAFVLDGESYTVVGVTAPEFEFPGRIDLFLPLAPDPDYPRGDHRIEVFGRLGPGVTLDQARAELDAVAERLSKQYPESNGGWGVRIFSFREWLIGPYVTRASLVLLGAVGLLLVLATANVSNLLLVRATLRRTEVAMRMVLGAGRHHLVRQLLTESVLLALMGAALGLILAFWSTPVIATLGVLPDLVEVTIDGRVLLFTLLVTVGVGILFGLAPALYTRRTDLHATIQAGGRNAPPSERRLRNALVVGEIALAMVLLISAGLLIRSFLQLQRVDPGFETEGILALTLGLPAERYPEFTPPVGAFYREILERIEKIPGVVSAGATMVWPFSGFHPKNHLSVPGTSRDPDELLYHQWRAVTPGYFRTMGVPLLAGRLFDDRDRFDDIADLKALQTGEVTVPVIVTETTAERLWPGENPIGRPLRWGQVFGLPLEVVGVVGDVQDVDYGADPELMLFFSHGQLAWSDMTVVIRTDGPVAGLGEAVQRQIRAVDKGLAVPALEPLAEGVQRAMAQPRFYMLLMGLFAAVALVMAVTGIYGVLSFAVARRTREIGIRLALGARPGNMLGLVVRTGLRLIAVGVVLGAGGALAASRLMESLLYDTPAVQGSTYAGVAVLLGAVALLASLLPARRATRVDPREAILTE